MRYNFDRDSIFNIYENFVPDMDPKKEVMDKTVFKEFETKLVRAKFNLYRKYPFFGLLLQKMKTVPVGPEEEKMYGIDTMAVDNFRNIYINVRFTLGLTDDAVMGILAHEVMHIATLSFPRQRGRDQTLWNVATDFIMNRDLLIQGFTLMEGGCNPVDKGGIWVVPPIPGLTSKDIDVTDMTAEQLYSALEPAYNKNKEKMEEMLGKLQEQLDKHISDEQAKQIQGQGVPTEDPSFQKNAPVGDAKQQENSNKANVSQAAQQAQDEAKRRGTDPGLPRSFDKRLLGGKTDWKRLLKDFIVGKAVSVTDWAKENRRLGGGHYFHPRRVQVKSELQAIIGIDTSGSIGDPVLSTFLGEIINIVKSHSSKHLKLIILMWHTNVYRSLEIDTKKMPLSKIIESIKNMKAIGGGTDISSISRWLDKNMPGKKIKGGLLVFTDGYVEDNPILPNAPKKLFLIQEGGTDEILKKYGPTYFIDVPYA